MKKGYNKVAIIEIILLILLLFNSFVFKIANTYEVVGLLLPFLILMIVLSGFKKDNFRYKKDVLLTVLACLLIYYFITYMLGLFTGFLRSPYSYYVITVIKNILPVILLIIVSEFLRYQIFTSLRSNTLCKVLGFVIFVVVDVNIMVHTYDVLTYAGLTKMVCLVLFPSITKNILLIYLTEKSGYTNAIIYRLITELSIYLLPIFPNFGEYINVLIKTLLPILIVFRLNNMFSYYEIRKIKSSNYNKRKLVLYSVITFALLVIVVLTSGLFKYQALAIGSNSMKPTIIKGDVVILKKVKKSELRNIKKGDILVYNHDKKILVHRVVEILNLNGNINFVTKGDNNNSKDAWIIKEEEVLGISRFKIRYIGIPTVALNDLLNK